ncbi:hypothetical protein [Fulvivirga sediminis]|uniref:Uncharacterized protein n=1 Tax=Fulvivirga sediminis TaxID=2803949 RepID=A0A937F5U5_9BACT|nr:hypothetical protein [Fulvivirga sediminis]MBL3655561.1 hypothetical protein [Fulvivirga sediminis]
MKCIPIYKFLACLIIVLLHQQNILMAQKASYAIKEENIQLANKTVVIPQIYKINEVDTIKMKALNDKVISRFNIIHNTPNNEADYEEFVNNLDFFEDSAGFLDANFAYKIEGDLVEINIEGNYADFQGKPLFEIDLTYNQETFYVDLKNSEILNASGYNVEIKLKYFFNPKAYLELLSKT